MGNKSSTLSLSDDVDMNYYMVDTTPEIKAIKEKYDVRDTIRSSVILCDDTLIYRLSYYCTLALYDKRTYQRVILNDECTTFRDIRIVSGGYLLLFTNIQAMYVKVIREVDTPTPGTRYFLYGCADYSITFS